jgi:hypothetical protein
VFGSTLTKITGRRLDSIAQKESFTSIARSRGLLLRQDFPAKTIAPLAVSRPYDLKLVVDRSSIEAYAQNGFRRQRFYFIQEDKKSEQQAKSTFRACCRLVRPVKRPMSRSRASATKALSTPIPIAMIERKMTRLLALKSPRFMSASAIQTGC